MNILWRYKMLIALAEIFQGLTTLLTLGWIRPFWTTELRMIAAIEAAGRMEKNWERANALDAMNEEES